MQEPVQPRGQWAAVEGEEMALEAGKPGILVGHVTGDAADLPPGVIYHPGRMPDAARRVPEGVEVLDDPEVIAWVRRAAATEMAGRYEAALERVRAGEWLYPEHQAGLAALRERSVPALAALMRDPSQTGPARARAAQALMDLGEEQGGEFLVEALSPADPQLCAAALERLNEFSSRVDLSRPEVAVRIVSLFSADDPEVLAKAAHLCAWKDVAGAEGPLRAAVERGAEPRQKLAECLAQRATMPESVQAALPNLFPEAGTEYRSTAFLFARALAGPDPAVSGRLRAALRQHLLRYDWPVRFNQQWARDFVDAARAEDRPVLERILAEAEDPVSRAYALRALGRLHPEEAVARALDAVRREGPWSLLVDLLMEHAGEADYPAIVEAFFPGGKIRMDLRTARLFQQRLGESGRRFLQAHLCAMEAATRREIEERRDRLDLEGTVSALHAAGVLPGDPEPLLREIRRDMRPGEEEPEGADALLTVLTTAGRMSYFDTETGFVPCEHHDLIRDLARGSGGRFMPECAVQFWLQDSEDDFDAPYLLHFLHGSRAYRFYAENFGDYYDVASILEALNFALEQAGMPERYLMLESGDQCAQIVFADPRGFGPIAERCGLTLAEDPSAPMRAGRAYEARVFGEE